MNLFDNYKKNSFEEIFYPNVPFENSAINPLKGYLLSLKMLILHPFGFYKLMHVNKGFLKPFFFAVFNVLLSVFFTGLYMHLNLVDTPKEQLDKAILQTVDLPVQLQEMLTAMRDRLPEFSFDVSFLLLQSLGTLLNLLLLIMIWQTALSIFRLADNGLQATWRVICYASAAMLLNLLPANQLFIGIMVAMWGFLLIVIGLSEAHELTWKRTLLAALSLPMGILLFLLPALLMR